MATKIRGVAVKWSQNRKDYENIKLYDSKCWTNMSFETNRIWNKRQAYHFYNCVAVIGEVSVTMGDFTHYFINGKYRTNGPGIVSKNGSQEWFDENGYITKMIDQFGRNLLTLDLDALLEEWKQKKKAGFNGK